MTPGGDRLHLQMPKPLKGLPPPRPAPSRRHGKVTFLPRSQPCPPPAHSPAFVTTARDPGSVCLRKVFQRGEDENKYLLPGATVTGEHTLRVRVRHAYRTIWSDWSATCSFGEPPGNACGP